MPPSDYAVSFWMDENFPAAVGRANLWRFGPVLCNIKLDGSMELQCQRNTDDARGELSRKRLVFTAV